MVINSGHAKYRASSMCWPRPACRDIPSVFLTYQYVHTCAGNLGKGPAVVIAATFAGLTATGQHIRRCLHSTSAVVWTKALSSKKRLKGLQKMTKGCERRRVQEKRRIEELELLHLPIVDGPGGEVLEHILQPMTYLGRSGFQPQVDSLTTC